MVVLVVGPRDEVGDVHDRDVITLKEVWRDEKEAIS